MLWSSTNCLSQVPKAHFTNASKLWFTCPSGMIMEPNFMLIGFLLEYRSAIQFLAVIDILAGLAAFLLDLMRKLITAVVRFTRQLRYL